MFDADYFKTGLQADIDAQGGNAVVEIHLINGRAHRLRSVVSVQDGYVTLEAYETRGDEIARKPTWREMLDARSPHLTERAIIAYESVVSVLVVPTRAQNAPAIGFLGK